MQFHGVSSLWLFSGAPGRRVDPGRPASCGPVRCWSDGRTRSGDVRVCGTSRSGHGAGLWARRQAV
ncbi:hypothetical protein L665_02237 [Ralstonia solanacearum SD54]|nr:hypothetical protein F504_1055 [Ralstonia pseudosolanacearum FQY_4]ESS48791.1 hypothetical protein L665_02237 [Ralstonia solanacearum SD54]